MTGEEWSGRGLTHDDAPEGCQTARGAATTSTAADTNSGAREDEVEEVAPPRTSRQVRPRRRGRDPKQEPCCDDQHVSDSWPPDGHSHVYRVQSSEGLLDFEMTVPRNMTEIDLATVRLARKGGPNAADYEFREKLYRIIGSITVAGSHVEAAMKRLLVILTGTRTVFEVVDYQWADLHKKLLGECDGSDQRRRDLRKTLEWSEKHDLRERRNTAVHGAWWVFAGPGVRVSRWPRRDHGAMIEVDLDTWSATAAKSWELVRRLDDLLGEEWPRAMLPAEPAGEAWRRRT